MPRNIGLDVPHKAGGYNRISTFSYQVTKQILPSSCFSIRRDAAKKICRDADLTRGNAWRCEINRFKCRCQFCRK